MGPAPKRRDTPISNTSTAGAPEASRGHRGDDIISAAIGQFGEKAPRSGAIPANPSYTSAGMAGGVGDLPGRYHALIWAAFPRLRRPCSPTYRQGAGGGSSRRGPKMRGWAVAAGVYISIFSLRMECPGDTRISGIASARSSRWRLLLPTPRLSLDRYCGFSETSDIHVREDPRPPSRALLYSPGEPP